MLYRMLVIEQKERSSSKDLVDSFYLLENQIEKESLTYYVI